MNKIETKFVMVIWIPQCPHGASSYKHDDVYCPICNTRFQPHPVWYKMDNMHFFEGEKNDL